MPITTIPFSSRKAGPYTATGGQTVFSFAFPILAAGDIDVYRKRAGVVTLLLLTTDYSVTGVGEQAGGTIVLTAGALAGDIIAIDGDLLKQRQASYIGSSPFKASVIDADLNTLAIMVQELGREVERSIRRASVDAATGSLLLPQDVAANTILALNSSGALIGLVAADFSGPQGVSGPAGTSILSGSGAPSNGIGSNGDFYLDTTSANYNLYGPKTAGVWGAPISLKGPTGAGTGDVLGPASATVGHAAVFAHSSGKEIGSAGGPPALTGAANIFSAAQTIERTTDADALVARNTDNTAAQRTLLRAERGSGAGADYILASLGDAANGVAALLELIGATELRRLFATYTRFNRQVVACSSDSAPPALTDGVTVNWDWASQQTATLSIAGNRTLNTPANARPGSTAMLALTASGDTRTLTLTTAYSLPTAFASPLTIKAGEEWTLAVWYDGTRYKAVPTLFKAVP